MISYKAIRKNKTLIQVLATPSNKSDKDGSGSE